MVRIWDRLSPGVKVAIIGAAATIIAAVIAGIFLLLSTFLNRPPTPPPSPIFTQQAALPSHTLAFTQQGALPSDTPPPTTAPNQTPLANPLGYPGNPVTSNGQWTPTTQSFNGVDMVLVPAGCFMMGSRRLFDQTPPHQQCFEQPFWLDTYEVTNAQFQHLGGQAKRSGYPNFTGPQQPRGMIEWFEALAFCEQQRGARLPTEREWEYAARGPDNWGYPWGPAFPPAPIVYNHSSPATAPVGSQPSGASWVGALDMSGNAWEWVSTIYDPQNFPYPYKAGDGREDKANKSSHRGMRGGSWYDTERELSASFRSRRTPAYVDKGVGFRCARDWEG